MPRVGFEHTIPAFERTKTVHALDRAANMIGKMANGSTKNGKEEKFIFLFPLP
jgi:hypothetical protein